MTFSVEWDEQYKSNAHLSVWPWSDVVSLTMRNCRNSFSKQFNVLELGCGAGANIPFFLKNNLNYFAIEGSPEIVESLKKSYPQISGHIKVGDFTRSIDFEETFDLILDRASVTCNCEKSIRSTMKLVHQKLKPGGKFIGVDWYSAENTEFHIGDKIDDEYTRIFRERGEFLNTGRVHFFDRRHLESFFEDFKILSLSHKEYRQCIPEKNGYKFCSWNLVAQKA